MSPTENRAEPGLQALAFPKLTERQIERLASCTGAGRERYPAGTPLFRCGDRGFKFFIIESGEVEIVDETGDLPRTLFVHRAGEFTGDVSHLTGRPAPVTAIARVDSEVYELSEDRLRKALNECPDLADVILQAFIARRHLLTESGEFTGLRVIGSRYSRDTFRVRDFLAKNRVPFTWLDLESDPEVVLLLRRFGVTEKDTPVVACGRMLLLRNPSNRELAEEVGIKHPIEQSVYDLVIVGAGPAGLAAAVYGASEGLGTLVLERIAPGGQAGLSMRIENYLGFPAGITGNELADRAVLQASKFGAVLSIPSPVVGMTFEAGYPLVTLESGEAIQARSLIIATGAEYRRLLAAGCEPFEGCGVYYAATPNEAPLCRGARVVVVGGGNSAGQAAVFLSAHARQVVVVIRGDDLRERMSAYLVDRIESTPNIEVLTSSEVTRMSGDGHLGVVEIKNRKTGETRELETAALFSFIGAVPRTDWLPPEIEKDSKGFVCTGPDLWRRGTQRDRVDDGERDRFLLETSAKGVFAAGDVRASSVKRVASAVGEGAMAVQFVHQALRER